MSLVKPYSFAHVINQLNYSTNPGLINLRDFCISPSTLTREFL